MDDLVKEARDAFDLAVEAENENRAAGLDDLRFARLSKQWPDDIIKQREIDRRPVLTVNRLPTFIRQVVNEARQMKPSIKVHPADDKADPETAEIMNGLIRNIEYTSNADVAYDTATECAVTMGFGYFTVDIDYAYDDSFDLDIQINRVADPLSIYGDPTSTAADSSDWNTAFQTEWLTNEAFKFEFPDADPVDWESDRGAAQDWFRDDEIMVAKWWKREQVRKTILQLSDGRTMDEESFLQAQDFLAIDGVDVVNSREVMAYQVKRHLMTGKEVLKTEDWAGCYIPIIPVYGDEVNEEGKRHFISLIRHAKDAQRMYNYWRPLALDTPLPTPSGWTTMGAVNVGDKVFAEDGSPCEVVGKSPIHINRDCFRVSFDDGSSIVADAGHPWPVEERGKRQAGGFEWIGRLATTAELEPGKHFIPTAKPIQCVNARLPIDPYLLGLWLGDGDSTCGRITPGDDDIADIRTNLEEVGCSLGPIVKSGDRHGTFTVYGLTAKLRDSALLHNKHVPSAYLRGSEAQRWSLLQGLMDSDGHIAASGQCGFTSTNRALADGVAELLRSLGIKAVSCQREGRASMLVNGCALLPSYQFSFSAYVSEPLSRLKRKMDNLGKRAEQRRRTKRHRVVSVEPVASVPVQCIAIDAPSHLFLAGEAMVPTHNTAATELVALAPKVPFIGPKGAFKSDARNWATANTTSHPYLEYDGQQPPQRQPLDTGAAAGALQESMNAADDMKAIMGIYDPSMGAQSNETSGKAIIARERQGDVANFHFQDNMSRAIRHAGRILIDLIPKVYDSERIIRILGEDGTPSIARLKQPVPQTDENGRPMMEPATDQMGRPIMDPQTGQPAKQPVMRIFDLGAGKYDLTVSSGPSYNTMRQESASQMIEMMRMNPAVAPLIGDLVAKNLDWPGADEIARRLKAMLPPNLQDPNALPPEVQQMIEQGKQTIEGQQQMIQQMQDYIRKLENDHSIDQQKVDIDQYEAKTDRMDTLAKMQQAEFNPVNVPDAGVGPYADFEGIRLAADASLAQARAAKGWADAETAQNRAVQGQMMPMQPPPGRF